MKTIFVAITALTLFTMTTHAQTSTTTDDALIRDQVKYLEDGWAKKDGKLFATPFADNADYVIINGMHIKGKKTIAESHQMIFNTFYKETFIKAPVESIRYLRPDVAIVHLNGSMTGMSDGRVVDSHATMTLVMEKSAKGWQIAAFQNTALEPPAGKSAN